MKFKYQNQILAVFFTLSLSHMASAALITVEADVLANTGSSVTFAPFDIGLGTLTGARLTYNFTALYNFYNDGDFAIAANDWQSNARIIIIDSKGQLFSSGSETHGSINLELSQAWVNIMVIDEELLLDRIQFQYNIEWYHNYPSVPGLGDWVIVPNIMAEGHTAMAKVVYTYEAVRAGSPSPVPTPPTLALFTLGLMGLAARQLKKKS